MNNNIEQSKFLRLKIVIHLLSKSDVDGIRELYDKKTIIIIITGVL